MVKISTTPVLRQVVVIDEQEALDQSFDGERSKMGGHPLRVLQGVKSSVAQDKKNGVKHSIRHASRQTRHNSDVNEISQFRHRGLEKKLPILKKVAKQSERNGQDAAMEGLVRLHGLDRKYFLNPGRQHKLAKMMLDKRYTRDPAERYAMILRKTKYNRLDPYIAEKILKEADRATPADREKILLALARHPLDYYVEDVGQLVGEIIGLLPKQMASARACTLINMAASFRDWDPEQRESLGKAIISAATALPDGRPRDHILNTLIDCVQAEHNHRVRLGMPTCPTLNELYGLAKTSLPYRGSEPGVGTRLFKAVTRFCRTILHGVAAFFRRLLSVSQLGIDRRNVQARGR